MSNNESTISSKYADELIKNDIPKLENRLRNKEAEEKELNRYLSGIKLFVCPFEFHNQENMSILSKGFDVSWERYKKLLYEFWRDEANGKRLISENFDLILYIAWNILGFASLIVIIAQGIHNTLNINFLLFAGIWYFLMETIAGIISIYYYVIRANNINRRITKRMIKAIRAEKKLINNELNTKKSLVEAYKLSTLNPEKHLADIKKKASESLVDELNYSINEVVPSISKKYSSRYLAILNKCDKLLRMSKENGSIITEISKIYNIYINEINNILTRVTDENEKEIIEMLDNFDSYIDRKLSKYTELSKMSISSDIRALSNAFKEDC